MTVGKLFEFASKPEQPGLSSSISLELMMERTWYTDDFVFSETVNNEILAIAR